MVPPAVAYARGGHLLIVDKTDGLLYFRTRIKKAFQNRISCCREVVLSSKAAIAVRKRSGKGYFLAGRQILGRI